ncbi:unnamed protein product [Diamesa serratosioi]
MVRTRASARSLYKARNHNSVSSSSSSTHKMRRKRKDKEKKRKKIPSDVCDNDDIMIIDDIKSTSEDDEELELRLELLKSKLDENDLKDLEVAAKKPEIFVKRQPTEEEELRILALKSAMLKSHERRKNRQKLENERPYSPSEDIIPLHPLTIDIDSFMEISPIVSPVEEEGNVDVTDPIDMEISNSPINYTEFVDDVIEVIPMDDIIYPQEAIVNIDKLEELDDEENELRTLLLSSISTKKPKEDEKQPDSPEPMNLASPMNILSSDEETLPGITKNLKLALERLKLKSKLNTLKKKTIAEVLQKQKEIRDSARSKLSAIVKQSTDQKTDKVLDTLVCDPIVVASNSSVLTNLQKPIDKTIENPATKLSLVSKTSNSDPTAIVDTKCVLNSEVPKNLHLLETSMISPSITDTKNIPRKSNFKKQSKLITSLKDVIRPVPKLIITLKASESDSDMENKDKSPLKKTPRRIVKAPGFKPKSPTVQPEFQKNLDSFLKNIRSKQETPKTSPSAVKPALSTTKASSAVKHLPFASQQEYEKLLKKMKMLEESKKNKQKLRQLNRIKSITNTEKPGSSDVLQPATKVQEDLAISEILVLNPPSIASGSKEESTEDANKKKISLYLSKISNLAEPVQKRLLDKSESNYRNHSDQLMEQINNNVELLNSNEIELKKQLRLRSHVQKLEQLMKTYKEKLQQTNDKIKLNYPKIIRSQRDMVQCKVQQQRFSVLCDQVGQTVHGQTYKLPDRQSLQMVENLKIIAEKNGDILKITSNPQVSSHIRFLSAKVKQYIADSSLIDDKIEDVVSVNNEVQDIIINQEVAVDIPLIESETVECIEKVQCTESPDLPIEVDAINNNLDEISAKDQIVVANDAIVNNNIEPKLPETSTIVTIAIDNSETLETNKETLEDVCSSKRKITIPETDVYLKKFKYDSPLGLLKINNSNLTDPNAILCPFELMNPGSCQDESCKMSHLVT